MKYPLPDSLINLFFKLLTRLSSASTLDAVSSVWTDIAAYEPTLQARAALFGEANAVTQDKPTAYQVQILTCEHDILQFMRLLYDYKLRELHADIDQRLWEGNARDLLQRCASPASSGYSLLYALRYYMKILVSIMLLDECTTSLSAEQTMNIFFSAFAILNDIYEFKNSVHHLQWQVTDNLDIGVITGLRSCMLMMLTDGEPRVDSHQTTYYANGVLARKLFKLREPLELKERAMKAAFSKQSNVKAICHSQDLVVYDRIAHIDAILRRLNLTGFKGCRSKFNAQAVAYHTIAKHLDIIMWSANVETDIYNYLKHANEALHERTENFEFIYSSLMVLKNANITNFPVDMKDVFINELVNVYMKICLMINHALEVKPVKKTGEGEDRYQTRITEYDHLLEDLRMLRRYSTTMIYLLQRAYEDKVTYSQALQPALKEIEELSLDTINFVQIRNHKLGSLAGSLLHLRMILRLDKAECPEDRLAVITDAAVSVICLMIRLNEECEHYSDDMIATASHIIMDFYFASILICKNADEAAHLINLNFHGMIPQFFSELDNQYLYDFLYRLLAMSCAASIPVADINEKFWVSFPVKQIPVMYQLCELPMRRFVQTEFKRASTLCRTSFLQQAGIYLTYLVNHEQHGLAGKASQLKERLTDIYEHLRSFIQQCASSVVTSELVTDSLRFLNIKSSYLPESLPSKPKPAVRVAKKDQKNKAQRSASRPRAQKKIVTIDTPFSEVWQHYAEDVQCVIDHYRSSLFRHDRKVCAAALLGMAECIPRVKKQEKQAALIKEITEHARNILDNCQKYSLPSEFDKIKLRYDELLAPWLPAASTPAPATQKAPAAVTAPVASVTRDAGSVSLARAPAEQASVITSSFFNRQSPVNTAIVPPLPAVRPLQRKVEDKDPFKYMRHAHVLNINVTELRGFIQCLSRHNLHPLIHGGAVVDTLLGIPYRDIDLMCFATHADLSRILEANRSALGINSIHKLHSNVLVVSYRPSPDSDNLEEIEVAFVPCQQPQDMANRLRDQARNYGINLTLYYDPVNETIVDPLLQYKRIYKQRTLDVGQVLSIDMNSYFKDYPVRILDCAYKYAKYRHYHVILTITEDVLTGINNNRSRLLNSLDKRTSFVRLGKLFLQGHAAASFATLNDNRFDLIGVLFPMATVAQRDFIYAACVEMDMYLSKQVLQPGSRTQREALCARFLASALYPIFAAAHDVQSLVTSKDSYYVACVQFLNQCTLKLTSDLISLVQDAWLETITASHRKSMTCQ